MVTPQGFNALLKLVEEPPPHLKFIFATTEPDKVIATIRSRTHHYPFRLVPPRCCAIISRGSATRRASPSSRPCCPRRPRRRRIGARRAVDARPAGRRRRRRRRHLHARGRAARLHRRRPARRRGRRVRRTRRRVRSSGCRPGRREPATTHDASPRTCSSGYAICSCSTRCPTRGSRACSTLPRRPARADDAPVGQLGRAELSRAADIVHAGLTEMRGTTRPRLLLELTAPGCCCRRGGRLRRLAGPARTARTPTGVGRGAAAQSAAAERCSTHGRASQGRDSKGRATQARSGRTRQRRSPCHPPRLRNPGPQLQRQAVRLLPPPRRRPRRRPPLPLTPAERVW